MPPAEAQTKQENPLLHLVLLDAATAFVVGTASTAYALSVGPWSSNPLRGVEMRFAEVCEKLLGGTWKSGAPDSCPDGKWLRVWGIK
jgi:hypothetical protein